MQHKQPDIPCRTISLNVLCVNTIIIASQLEWQGRVAGFTVFSTVVFCVCIVCYCHFWHATLLEYTGALVKHILVYSFLNKDIKVLYMCCVHTVAVHKVWYIPLHQTDNSNTRANYSADVFITYLEVLANYVCIYIVLASPSCSIYLCSYSIDFICIVLCI